MQHLSPALMRLGALLLIGAPLGLSACGDDDGSPSDGAVADDGVDSGNDDAGTDAATEDAGQADSGTDSATEDAAPADEGVDLGMIDCSDRGAPRLATEAIGGFRQPVFITAAPDDPDRLYIVEKEGRIMIWEDGNVLDTPFLTVSGINTDGEQGLLSMAFAPDYAESGRFFVYLTPSRPRRNAIDEYARSEANPLVANPERVARLVSIDDIYSNHNGGNLQFGPDGFLYAGTGDEGDGGDPEDNGLDTGTLHGNILRLDINNPDGDYAAEGNPFIDGPGLPQIWAYGARNPWRISFDRLTGDLYVADVGQNRFEEISVLGPDDGGANLGWRAYEGFSVFRDRDVSRVPVHHEPIHVYPHRDFDSESIRGGSSITGGYVYRGEAIPELQGFYLFADFNSADVAALRYCEGEATSVQRVDFEGGTPSSIASFGEDGNGEMYIVSIRGTVSRIVGAAE